MKTKWVFAIAIAMWMSGVATHMALLAVTTEEEWECVACEGVCNAAPEPAMETTAQIEELNEKIRRIEMKVLIDEIESYQTQP